MRRENVVWVFAAIYRTMRHRDSALHRVAGDAELCTPGRDSRLLAAMARFSTSVSRYGAAALFGVLLCGGASVTTARAEPMKCSDEEKVCATTCARTTPKASLSVCVTNCGTRMSMCAKTGCWDDGTQKTCGLSRK